MRTTCALERDETPAKGWPEDYRICYELLKAVALSQQSYVMKPHTLSPPKTHTHTNTHTHHPSIHLLLSSENAKGVRRCRPFRLVLRCWWSGLTETLVVVKPLLMECLVAVLTLDRLYGEVTLSLMVGQTCLIPSLKRAARMVAV